MATQAPLSHTTYTFPKDLSEGPIIDSAGSTIYNLYNITGLFGSHTTVLKRPNDEVVATIRWPGYIETTDGRTAVSDFLEGRDLLWSGQQCHRTQDNIIIASYNPQKISLWGRNKLATLTIGPQCLSQWDLDYLIEALLLNEGERKISKSKKSRSSRGGNSRTWGNWGVEVSYGGSGWWGGGGTSYGGDGGGWGGWGGGGGGDGGGGGCGGGGGGGGSC